MIYFDNNATTRPAPEVVEAMMPFLTEDFGNPSSIHAAGEAPRKIVEKSRESVASLVGAARTDEIAFTSGGTESDNWALVGALRARNEKRHVVTTSVEHEAVIKTLGALGDGVELTILDVGEDGALDPDAFRAALRNDTAIVSVMMANNETGVVFPVAELAALTKEHSDALFHVDGVNAVGKVAIDLKSTEIDLFSLSAHKFHGPKGVGALYIRDGVELPSYFFGGGQERGRRAGTTAVHQIAGLGRAAEIVADMSAMTKVGELRRRLEDEILQKIPNSRLNGTRDEARRLPNTSNISFEFVNGESILARLDALGVCVSTGSACAAGSHAASSVLEAMDVPFSFIMGSVRFSLGRYNTADEVEFVLENLPRIVSELRAFSV